MIKIKPKICISCGELVQLFSHGECLTCYRKNHANSPKSKPSRKNRIKPIKRSSNSAIERSRKYKELRDIYLKEHPICEYPDCNSRQVECHHKAGRSGENLFKHFCSICRIHHEWLHRNTLEAYKLGLLLPRFKKEKIDNL